MLSLKDEIDNNNEENIILEYIDEENGEEHDNICQESEGATTGKENIAGSSQRAKKKSKCTEWCIVDAHRNP